MVRLGRASERKKETVERKREGREKGEWKKERRGKERELTFNLIGEGLAILLFVLLGSGEDLGSASCGAQFDQHIIIRSRPCKGFVELIRKTLIGVSEKLEEYRFKPKAGFICNVFFEATFVHVLVSLLDVLKVRVADHSFKGTLVARVQVVFETV